MSDGLGNPVAPGDVVSTQLVAGATTTTSANVLIYTASKCANAAALEVALEADGGILTVGAGGLVADNDGFVIAYINTDTNAWTYAFMTNTIGAAALVGDKLYSVDVVDIATTDLASPIQSANFAFV